MTIKKETLAEQVYHQLRKDILWGKYPLGQKMLLRELVDDLGISVTPLREAINRLVQDGFMEYSTNRGVRIVTLSDKEIEDLLNIRKLYDQYAVQCIMEKEDRTEVVNKLQAVVDRQWVFLKNPDNRQEVPDEIAYSFHGLLSIETNNERLIKSAEKCNNLLHLADQVRKTKQYPVEGILEHTAIINEIKNGTCESALDAVQAHIDGEKRRFGL